MSGADFAQSARSAESKKPYSLIPNSLLSAVPESPKVLRKRNAIRGGFRLPAALLLEPGNWLQATPLQSAPWMVAALVALVAGTLDWRYRRIPNWLTLSGLVAGLAVNTFLHRWPGLKAALLGALLGLGVLLPFVLIRSLGAGDWKLAGALGACIGPNQMLSILIGTILVAGLMALAVVIWSGRLKQTLLNIAHLLAALLSLRMPGREVSLDNPQSTRIPFGVAMAATVFFYGIGRATGRL